MNWKCLKFSWYILKRLLISNIENLILITLTTFIFFIRENELSILKMNLDDFLILKKIITLENEFYNIRNSFSNIRKYVSNTKIHFLVLRNIFVV